MSKWRNLPINLDYQADFNHDNSRCVNYNKQSMLGKKSSIRRNLFPNKCPTFYYKTKSALSSSVTKINRALNTCKNKITSAVQNFHLNSYRRHTFEDCEYVPSDFQTPSRKTRIILGRTPIKLYSPFGIETPTIHQ